MKRLYDQGVTNASSIMDAYLKRGPVRVMFRKNCGHRVGSFPSRKSGPYAIYGGPEELKAMKWLEIRRDVRRFLEQPMEIEHGDDRVYTPDLLIEFWNGTLEVWDPKPQYLYDQGFESIEAMAIEKLRIFDVGYKVMKEKDLPSGHFEANIDLLLSYKRYPLNGYEALLVHWPADEALTVEDLCRGVLGEAFDLGQIINMVGRRYLALDLNEPIEDHTQVRLGEVAPQQGDCHERPMSNQ